ncbi:hypothetical protein [Nocardia mikamii]|uniref:hypothetical protein n=1 Tax=Nocardia mikamii TaxID=508464 RepID=UPI0007A41FC4|nr:hypothetical protein [Nocardia mikamii]
MGDPLSETLKINGADAAILARNVKARAGEIKDVKHGEAATTVTNGFPGFTIGEACTTAGTAASQALRDLSTALDVIGDNTVTVSAKFLHIDEARAREFDRADAGR